MKIPRHIEDLILALFRHDVIAEIRSGELHLLPPPTVAAALLVSRLTSAELEGLELALLEVPVIARLLEAAWAERSHLANWLLTQGSEAVQ
jgi:hypothetical protein